MALYLDENQIINADFQHPTNLLEDF